MAGAPHKQRVSDHQNRRSNPSSPSSRSGSGSMSNHSGGRQGDAPASNVPSPADSSSGPRSGLGGYDGNHDSDSHSSQRNPATSRIIVDPKNFDLGMAGWSTVHAYAVPTVMPPRPAPSTLGQPIRVGLNSFRVNKIPNTPVYQYDVIIGNGTEKRGLMNKVWQSKAIRAALSTGWIYDGNKLAWSLKSMDREIRLEVDLDSTDEGGDGKPRKSGKENKHRVVIKRTNTVGFAVLDAYLEGRADFDNTVLESINFFDHMLRETPRQRYTQIKRSFFARGQTRFDLGSGVEAFKGVYQTLRIGHLGGRRACLTVNVDVANGTFWKELPVHQAALQLTGRRDINDLITAVKQGGESSRTGQDLKKMRKLHVVAKHRGKDTVDPYVIDRFLYKGARDHKFEKDGKMISVYDHFASAYNIRLQYPDLPLALMTKGKAQGKMTVLPMEVLTIQPNERYAYKMDERQTSNMIKFAVTPPAERYKAIEHGLEMLKWDADPVHKAFGVEISRAKTVVDARLITAPKVQFGTGDAKPGTSGRWDLKGKKFLTPNTAPLKCWGVCVVPGRRGGKPDRSVVQNFVTEFCKVYKSHGGRVENTTPEFTLAAGDDVGQWVTMLWNQTGFEHLRSHQALRRVDRGGIRYVAACQTNGYRVEMITTANINEMLKPMIQNWVANVGAGKFPSRIIYFRDGVSEGQYQHVLQNEVQDMKALLKTANPTLNIPFIVIVGSKRHHVRFFPEKGDKNGNPMPGTLVETGVTHPFENDFYLCGHAAIKGTARPMHYHVLLNEVNMPNEELQTLIYEQSYQYIRATTPVSQHPAIYYAHIASNRAIPHDPRWAGSSDGAPPVVASRPRSGSQSGGSQGRSGDSSSQVPINVEKLLPMPNTSGIMTGMWFI
ncbi:Protein argonaute [Friedmanniomyces endolithicus]|nr:Protein argonaute [Friedmanniomyces endolithicus]